MAVFSDIHHLPAFRNAVITVGTFDGVHKGHTSILQELVQCAKEVNGESVLITFEPHPRKLLFPDQPLGILTPLEQKSKLILETGIEHIVIAQFTEAFSKLSADDYIENFLVGLFHPHTIIIGHDHHFGYDRKGNIGLLKKYETKYAYKLLEIPARLIDEAAVSSTKIRKALEAGHVNEASNMLGRNYSITGKVVKGAQLGRTLGYPTANIAPSDIDQLIPAIGIYAVYVIHKQMRLKGMLSIGFNPTVSDDKRIKIEVNIFDFDQDIYSETIDIEFGHRLRDEQKFDSLDALKAQLHLDKEKTINYLNHIK